MNQYYKLQLETCNTLSLSCLNNGSTAAAADLGVCLANGAATAGAGCNTGEGVAGACCPGNANNVGCGAGTAAIVDGVNGSCANGINTADGNSSCYTGAGTLDSGTSCSVGDTVT